MSSNPKEELLQACIKGGMSEADCRQKFADAMPKINTDADLMRENQMLRAEVEARKNQIKQATDLVTRVNQEKKAAEDAEKTRLIDTIMADSAYSKDQLEAKDLKTLQEINTTLKLNNNKTFAAVAADLAEQESRKKVFLSAGAWDAQKQSWVGGI
jgi:hypothetical protein